MGLIAPEPGQIESEAFPESGPMTLVPVYVARMIDREAAKDPDFLMGINYGWAGMWYWWRCSYMKHALGWDEGTNPAGAD